jgi:hypothetical protein
MGKLLLAPMEGLVDDLLRDVLTRVGGYDLAVSEFIRVSGSLLPARAFLRSLSRTRPRGSHRCRDAGGRSTPRQRPGLSRRQRGAPRFALAGGDRSQLRLSCANGQSPRRRRDAARRSRATVRIIVAAVRRAVPGGHPVHRQDAARACTIPRARSTVRGRSKPAASTHWWCMHGPGPRAIDRRRTGNGSPASTKSCSSR